MDEMIRDALRLLLSPAEERGAPAVHRGTLVLRESIAEQVS